MIGQRVGVPQVSFERGLQRGNGLLVEPEQQLLRGGGAEDFIEEDFEVRVGHGIEAERGLAHFADPLAQRGDVFGAEMRVQAEAHLEFIERLGGDARGKDLVQPLAGVVVTLEPADAFLDGEAGLRGLVHGTDPGQRRQMAIRLISAHKQDGVRGYLSIERPPWRSISNPGLNSGRLPLLFELRSARTDAVRGCGVWSNSRKSNHPIDANKPPHLAIL